MPETNETETPVAETFVPTIDPETPLQGETVTVVVADETAPWPTDEQLAVLVPQPAADDAPPLAHPTGLLYVLDLGDKSEKYFCGEDWAVTTDGTEDRNEVLALVAELVG